MIAEAQSNSIGTHCLGVFAKYWEPGQVKTRLARSLGDFKAARIYEAFVAATIGRLSAIDCQRVVMYTPDDDQTKAAFEGANIEGWSLVPQSEGHLGERMAAYFDEQFRAGAQRVVLLGSDSPNVPLVEVQEAFEHLKTAEVVLGPTDDGGYYLVGAAGRVPPIFEELSWSTPKLFNQTVELLQQHEISYAQLDPWYDVDELFDLHRLIADLQDQRDDEPALEVLLHHVLEVLEG